MDELSVMITKNVKFEICWLSKVSVVSLYHVCGVYFILNHDMHCTSTSKEFGIFINIKK